MPERDDVAEWPAHLDAVTAAPKNHRFLLEDESVRVLEVKVDPGEREEYHHHRWPSLNIILARPKLINYDADGREIRPAVEIGPDQAFPVVARLPPQHTHAIEIPAGEPHGLHGIRVEFKVT